MPPRLTRTIATALLAILLSPLSPAADAPAKTGDLDLTFTQRSPLSTPKELTRRLNLKEKDLGPDYDLSQRPFKAYIPTNYDPATPVGVIVYLGYKDTTGTPPAWRPVLEAKHLIFISPVCHSGTEYAPSVPQWQAVGLALDAVFNLKQQYAIDAHRIYQASWNRGSAQTAMATADEFTGFIVIGDGYYFRRIDLAPRTYMPPGFTRPPADLYQRSQARPFFLVQVDGDPTQAVIYKAITSAMKQDGFHHLQTAVLTSQEDLHYPNLKSEWFDQQALPFLDSAPPAPAAPAKAIAATAPSIPLAPVATNEPQRLLRMGKLYLANHLPDQARQKLQQVIDKYPNDPAAAEARQLLTQLAAPQN